ncbi:MAG: metallophosphoesterase, partial [Chitinophagaceae bacterium]
MKRTILFALLSLYFFPTVQAQTDTIANRIVLIGDAGALINGRHPVPDMVKKTIPFDKRTLIVYLGDNLYKEGLPDDAYVGYAEARSVLDSQVHIVENTPARLIMIPGNHDWNNGGEHGYQAILRQQNYVNILGKENVQFFPQDGCGGPVEVPLGKDVVLVIFDSQWWIHPYDKPGVESDCPYKTQTEVLTQLTDIFSRNLTKLVILACHHPFRSTGIHGGYFGIKQHIFPFTDKWKNLYIPLPGIGSIYPISRSVFGSPQDIPHPAYQNMIRDVEAVARTHPNVIFVAGHEHNLQLIKDSSYHYIVSGSGSKTSRVAKSRKTMYTAMEHGFATIDVSTNKNVDISFYITTGDSVKKDYSSHILNFSKISEKLEDTSKKVTGTVNAERKDTINVQAGERYGKASGIQRWALGDNYRKEWSTPVNMKVFHLKTERGGFKITGLGGGKQTKSLKLEDSNGKEWTLRTIDKDPELAIPENFRNSIAENIVQDMISAAHPYAPLAIPDLAKATGVIVPKPEFFFVPDDPALGIYQKMFSKTVCLLEEREPTIDGKSAKSTAKMLEKLVDDNDHRVDQEAVLRARLLDILIADWDRHFDQWKWGEIDTGKGKIYYPIAKDRDQAFFRSNGVLMWYISQQRMPFLRGFKSNLPQVNWLGFSARDFDRVFLNRLNAEDWKNALLQFQKDLTDTVIETAVHKLPKEIYEVGGTDITRRLKNRRDNLYKKGMKYYKFLSDYVNIIGTNEREYFHVSSVDSGLRVIVYGRQDRIDTSFKIYERVFKQGLTDEIRLYGLNGNDLFYVDENATSKIKMRIIGGKGNDTFNIKGHVRNMLYDMKDSVNYVLSTNRSKMRFSREVDVNTFNWAEYKYPEYRFPRIIAGFNPDDGLLLGAGFSRKTYGFRKDPYATDQRFSVMYAPNRGAYKLRYFG